MQAKDQRMRFSEEMLSGIKTIKFNSMEKFFMKRLENKRNPEIKKLITKKMLEVFMRIFAQFLPFIIISYTFSPGNLEFSY